VSLVHVLGRCACGLKNPCTFCYMVGKKISDEILSAQLRIYHFAGTHGPVMVPGS
jgi:hypothetical protein